MKTNFILLHGALGSKDQFLTLQKILDENFTTWTFNFEGHGGIETGKDFSIDLFVNNLIHFIRKNKIENASVFGYSMGGYVALRLAIDHPEIINKIITYGTKLKWDKESAEKEIRMMDAEKIELKIPQFAETLKLRHQPTDWKIVMKKTADMMNELGNGKSITLSSFEKIKNEVLICVGSDDKMVTQEESEEVAKKIPNAKLMILNGCKHPIEMVDENILTKVILDFMNK